MTARKNQKTPKMCPEKYPTGLVEKSASPQKADTVLNNTTGYKKMIGTRGEEQQKRSSPLYLR